MVGTSTRSSFNKALQALLNKFKYKDNPYPTTLDLIDFLEADANTEEKSYIQNLFAQITLYELRADEVSSTEMDDGKHKITFKVSATQFSADGKGEEAEQKFDEDVEIAFFTEDPNNFSVENKILYKQNHRLVSGDNVIEVITDEKPVYVGVDPFVRFIDRDTGNNVLKL